MSARFNVTEIFAALVDADIDYVVVGGLAVILHGHLRATSDLDLVISLEPENLRKAMETLEQLGLRPSLPVEMSDFSDPAKRKDWLENKHMEVFQLWDPNNAARSIDIFVHEPIPFQELNQASVIKKLETIPIKVASIEHLIAMKRKADRPRDHLDIAELEKLK